MNVPYHPDLEAHVVGTALATATGAATVAEHLEPGDCYVPGLRRLLAAAMELHDVVPARCDPSEVDWAGLCPLTYPNFEHLRAAAAATIADGDLGAALRLVDERYEPRVIGMCERVAESRRKRDMMAVLADAYNALGDGGDVEEVTELVSGIVA